MTIRAEVVKAIERMTGENALVLLKNDHEAILELIDQLNALNGRDGRQMDMREGLFAQLQYEIEIHTEAELKAFYPALDKDNRLREKVAEAEKEHAQWLKLLRALARMSPSGDTFMTRMAELQKKVEDHIHMEESELFPAAEADLGSSGLRQLGAQIQAIKQAAALKQGREPAPTQTGTKTGTQTRTKRRSPRQSSHLQAPKRARS